MDVSLSSITGDNCEPSWGDLADKGWLKRSPSSSIRQDFIKTEIWDKLEATGFTLESLTILEGLQILEG